MKSLKSLFALLAIVSVSFACASVTDASVSEAPNHDGTNIAAPAGAVFSTGNEPSPIVDKPII